MSAHKAKHPNNNPGPGQNSSRSPKESTGRHVYVEPGAQIDFVKDFREEYKASQNESALHNRKQLFWTIVSAALLFVYAGLTAFQSCENKRSTDATIKAAEAAKVSADTAKDTMIRSQRPWIGIVHTPVITFYPGRPVPSIAAIVVKNFGPLPALGVGQDFRVIKLRSSVDDELKVLDASCQIAELHTMKVKGASFGPTLFPTNEFTASVPFQEGGPFNEELAPSDQFLLVGCIAYTDQFSENVIHHTTTCFKPIGSITYGDFAAKRVDSEHGLCDCNFGHKID